MRAAASRRLTAILLSAIALFTPGAQALAQHGAFAADVRAWQAHDTRLIAIAWRLARANAPFCAVKQNAVGLILTDFHRFRDPAAVSGLLGIASGAAIEAVAPGSPAEAAGLRAGDALLAIGGGLVTTSMGKLPGGRFPEDLLHDRIDAELARSGTVTLRVASPGAAPRSVSIDGQTICRGRFTLMSSGTAAMSEGYLIRIAVQLMSEHSDDDEAAAMLAHELAHNIFGHVAENNARGRNYLTVRRNEREADRLAPWLMTNAGYDPAAAPRFMSLWGPRHSGGITRSQSHDGWRDRAAAMNGELGVIAAARAARPGQLIDWRLRLSVIQTD